MPPIAAARYQNSVSPTQQEAIDGIREMQSRMRLREDDLRFRNWSTDPNVQQHNRSPRRVEPSYPPPRYSPPPPEAWQPQQYQGGREPDKETAREAAREERREPQAAPGRQGQVHRGRNNYQDRRQARGINPLSSLFGGISPRQNRNYRSNPEPEQYPRQDPEPRQEARREAQHEAQPQPEAPPQPERKDTTLLQDILGGIGLDDDRILILGLILILVNDKADATLILALLYLLL